MIIRRQQIQEFIARDEAELTDVVRIAIRKSNEDRVKDYDDEQLNAMVKIGIERARANRLTCAEDIAAFVAVMFAVAPRFDEQKDIRQLLDWDLLPPDKAFYRIFDFAPETAWAEAERKYDDSFWFTGA